MEITQLLYSCSEETSQNHRGWKLSLHRFSNNLHKDVGEIHKDQNNVGKFCLEDRAELPDTMMPSIVIQGMVLTTTGLQCLSWGGL